MKFTDLDWHEKIMVFELKALGEMLEYSENTSIAHVAGIGGIVGNIANELENYLIEKAEEISEKRGG